MGSDDGGFKDTPAIPNSREAWSKFPFVLLPVLAELVALALKRLGLEDCFGASLIVIVLSCSIPTFSPTSNCSFFVSECVSNTSLGEIVYCLWARVPLRRVPVSS